MTNIFNLKQFSTRNEPILVYVYFTVDFNARLNLKITVLTKKYCNHCYTKT